MSCIESHHALLAHPKTRKFARLCAISVPQAIGHLHCLWWWAMDYASDGDITGFDRQTIADACLWEGNPDELWAGLTACGITDGPGFIDEDSEGRAVLHDWADHGGKVLAGKKANAERQARHREKARSKALRNANVTVTSPLHNTEKRETLPNPALSPCPSPRTPLPDSLTHPCTLPEKNINTPTPLFAPPASPPTEADVECVFEHFRTRIFEPFRAQFGDKTRPAKMASAAENPQLAREVRRLMEQDFCRGSPPLGADDLCRAIDNAVGSSDGWLRINGSRSMKWFFADRSRIEEYLAMQPRAKGTGGKDGPSGNGTSLRDGLDAEERERFKRFRGRATVY